MERLLTWLAAALDGRVFVALTRGLWDLAARDVLTYAEELQEGGGQQVRMCLCVRGGGGHSKYPANG